MHFIAAVLSISLLNCALALPAPVLKGPIFDSREIKFDDFSDKSRIFGGSLASNGQFPYMASLQRSNAHYCGTAIVSAVYLLSGAHCTLGMSPLSFTVVVGTTILNSGGTAYPLINIINHPNYDPTTVENDICILKTESAIIGSSVVASIPIGSSTIGSGVAVTLSGWGRTEEGYPNDLLFVNMHTIDNSECAQSLDPIFESSLCVSNQFGEGPCHGDSGGPLVASGVLVGLTSWGSPCGSGRPDVFARVSSYITWIQENAT